MTKQLKFKQAKKDLRKSRVRSTIYGTAKRPRLSVHISNMHVTAQLIDDESKKTLVYVSSIGQKGLESNLTKRAVWTGEEVAKKAKAAKIKSVVFDRGSKLYHGRVAALAEAARANGLEF